MLVSEGAKVEVAFVILKVILGTFGFFVSSAGAAGVAGTSTMSLTDGRAKAVTVVVNVDVDGEKQPRALCKQHHSALSFFHFFSQ
jgi:hypothetical protein